MIMNVERIEIASCKKFEQTGRADGKLRHPSCAQADGVMENHHRRVTVADLVPK
jgi:hypothetical protein